MCVIINNVLIEGECFPFLNWFCLNKVLEMTAEFPQSWRFSMQMYANSDLAQHTFLVRATNATKDVLSIFY